ncbi:MAG: S8 family serine peptidase [Gemmatimonadota bacterium]
MPRHLSWLTALLAIAAAAGAASGAPHPPTWVFFTDKADGRNGRVPWPTPEQVGAGLPLRGDVDPRYLARLEAAGVPPVAISRWFNAAVVRASAAQIQAVEALPWVRATRPAARFAPGAPAPPVPAGRPAAVATDYGASFDQAAAIGATVLHQAGYRGAGVRVAILDAGFNWRDHRCLAGARVVAARDFINGDDEVGDEPDEPVTGFEAAVDQNQHGTQVLSLLAGDLPGSLIGIAPEAEYLLAKTEEVAREDPVEEYRWIAALEWADSLGAQVLNTSLGYNFFDDGTGYTAADLDGQTALTTRAAELAVAAGMVVVAAAGNEGDKEWRYVTVPADGADVIAVGAVSALARAAGGFDYVIAPFSSRGPTADGRIKPDVVAPGVGLYAVSGRAADGPGSHSFALEEYAWVRGTSFAAPLVAGACALLLQVHPGWGPSQVADALRRTALDLGPAGPDTIFGWGAADALGASGLNVERPALTSARPPYPNPVAAAGPAAVVHFPVELAAPGPVAVEVYDVAGALVDCVEPFQLEAGAHVEPDQAVRWPVPADLASGLYFYRLRAGGLVRAGRIAVVRSD